ncbi:MAG: hypothetical protein ABIN97_10745 [Ginsengibacter sp.]
MFKSYLKIIVRNLWRNKLYTLINIIGTGVGIAMDSWLQSFVYRITISPFIFVIAEVSVILITLLTISFQAVKAAIANPIKSLRTE